MSDVRDGEVSRRIAATPAALYALVSDVTRTGLWAVECEQCRWLDGATAAAPGARFEGHNRYGQRTWTTVSVVDEAVPGQLFAFHTEGPAGPITRWWIALRPDGDGAMVTEGFERVRLPDPDENAFEDNLFGGRVRHNLANIAASLERLADLVEAD